MDISNFSLDIVCLDTNWMSLRSEVKGNQTATEVRYSLNYVTVANEISIIRVHDVYAQVETAIVRCSCRTRYIA